VYAELHCHSAYSFLDGASLPEELVAAALEQGQAAMAEREAELRAQLAEPGSGAG
jgi:DNA polymerase III alpha subunit